MGLIAYTSQTYDALLEKWIHLLLSEQQSLGPHESRIVVPNHRIANWLSRSMAKKLGVSMNLRFIYLDSLIADTLGPVQQQESSSFLKLEWAAQIWAMLKPENPHSLSLPESLQEKTRSDLQWMQDAWEFAELFQQYADHRPEWLEIWKQGKTIAGLPSPLATFQKELYRRMLRKGAPLHPYTQIDSTHPEANKIESIPTHFFGFWNFSPGQWKAIDFLAYTNPVFLYLPFPTNSYLADLTRKTLQQPLLLGEEGSKMGPNYMLLSKLGQRGRAMQILLLDQSIDIEELQGSDPEEPSYSNRLQALKAQISNPDTFELLNSLPVAAKDSSIQLHSVSNRRREVEVAKSLVQKALKDDPDLTLESIQIHAPDITPYAPILSEVFADENSEHSLLCSIQNSVDAEMVPGISVVIDLLQLLCSEWDTKNVLRWLSLDPVRESLEFSVSEIALIQHWVECAGIYRGNPGKLSSDKEKYSWEGGMQKLMQAYAGTLPVNALGGSGFEKDPPNQHIETFSKFCACYAFLKQTASTLISAPLNIEQYRNLLSRLISKVLPRSNEFEKQVLLSAINRLVEHFPLTYKLDAGIFIYLLRKTLPKLPPPQILSRKSGIQCSSIQLEDLTPCRLRILMGMNESDFPAVDVPQSHNLLQQSDQNEASDPSRKEDHRYWVLQSLHQTTDQWLVTYQGQDASGNVSRLLSPAIESVVQNLNRLTNKTAVKSNDSASEPWITPIQHPRFAYDSACFVDQHSSLRHFSRLDYKVARQLADAPSRNLTAPKPTPVSTPVEELTVWELANFFSHPNQYICEHHLGIRFPKTRDFVPEHEPLIWAGMANTYALKTDLLRSQVNALEGTRLKSVLDTHHTLLSGSLQELGVEWIRAEIDAIPKVSKIAELQLLESIEIHSQTTPFNGGIQLVHASLGALPPGTQQLGTIRASNLSAKHRVEAWIHLLALWGTQAADARCPFTLIGKDTLFKLVPPDNPREILQTLIEIYQSHPSGAVPFFPKTSEAYIKQQGSLDTIAQNAAWDGEHGEKLDPYNDYMFRGVSPFTTRFDEIASTVFVPLLHHSPSVRWKGGMK